jgi:hypothetical protein
VGVILQRYMEGTWEGYLGDVWGTHHRHRYTLYGVLYLPARGIRVVWLQMDCSISGLNTPVST